MWGWECIGKCAIGYAVFRVVFSLLKGFYGSFIASAFGLNTNIRKMGKWAVVTGSTDGIGKAYAFEMARRGLNVVLISRSQVKLNSVAAEIKSIYDVEIKTVAADFTRNDIYDRIYTEIDGLEIGILINNVGMSSEHPEYFSLASDPKFLENIMMCNMFSLTMMTRMILPQMEHRRKGLIVNVSSLSSRIPAPLLAVYGSTKAFVSTFSDSLAIEVASKGVIVQCVCPGFVVSNMSKIRRPSIMCPSAKGYVFSTLKTTGVESNTSGYFMHKLQLYGIELLQALPGCVIGNVVFSQLNAVRMKSIKRKERESKKE